MAARVVEQEKLFRARPHGGSRVAACERHGAQTSSPRSAGNGTCQSGLERPQPPTPDGSAAEPPRSLLEQAQYPLGNRKFVTA